MDITMGNFFSGSGTWELAAKICGIKVLFESEIEKFPVELEAQRFPEAIQLGDISKVNGYEIPAVDILTNSSPCFTGDSLVRTLDGLKPISEVQKGDYVLTHGNVFRKVMNSGKTGRRKVLRLCAQVVDQIVATPNHPFYVRSSSWKYPTLSSATKKYRPRVRVLNEPEWKQLSEITTDDYIGIPVYDGVGMQSCELTDNELWLVGKFLSDGNRLEDRQGVEFLVSKSQEEEFQAHLTGFRDGEVIGHCIKNKRFWQLCGECCDRGSSVDDIRTVHFPSIAQTISNRYSSVMMDGFLSGGAITCINGTYRVRVFSKKLALDLVYMVAKLYGVQSLMSADDSSGFNVYEVVFRKEQQKTDKCLYENSYLWVPVTGVEAAGMKDVYNLSVDGDESYTVQNIAVHNCQDLSVAGLRAGLDGARSGLFGEVIRITKEMREHDANTRSDEHIRPWIRPRLWCWENVPGAFSSNSGEDFRRVIEEVARIIEPTAVIPKPTKWGYAGVVDGNGWQIAWRTLDAQFFGVAQRRRRCFLVADLGGHCATEILFERESVSWHFKEISKAFEETSRSLGDRISIASQIVMGGIREDETGVGCVKEKAAGFDMYNHSVCGDDSPAVFHGDLSRE